MSDGVIATYDIIVYTRTIVMYLYYSALGIVEVLLDEYHIDIPYLYYHNVLYI